MKSRWILLFVFGSVLCGLSRGGGLNADDLMKRLGEKVRAGVQKTAAAESVRQAEMRSIMEDLAKAVYGTDDRFEYFRATQNQRAACDSTVALVKTSALKKNTDGTFRIDTLPSKSKMNWCEGERFGEQPSPAFCSGFVIANDRIATAGHCVRGTPGFDCSDTSVLFDFHWPEDKTYPLARIDSANIYRCQSVIDGKLDVTTGSDWRVFKVDRPFQNRTPLKLKLDKSLIAKDTKLTVIGYPVGLPVKIADNAAVRESSAPTYFVANLDTYGGNSGSPVFSTQSITDGHPIVEGILVRGEEDFKWSEQDHCYRSKVCANDGCRGEDVTRASELAGVIH